MLKNEKVLKVIAMLYDELNKSNSSTSRLYAVGVTLFDTVGRIAFSVLAPFDQLEEGFKNLFDGKIETSLAHFSLVFHGCFAFLGNILFIPIKLPYLLYKNIKDPASAHPIEPDAKIMLRGIKVLGSGIQFDNIIDNVARAFY